MNSDLLTYSEIEQRVDQGWRFLRFEETMSFIFVTRRQYSKPYFVAPGESHMPYAKKHIIKTALLGWWGIPWGFVGTPVSIVRNLRGGKDVTQEVLSSLR